MDSLQKKALVRDFFAETHTNYLAIFVYLQGDKIARIEEYVDTAAVHKMLDPLGP